jgi:transcription initiation factor TFIID subunit 1
MEHEETEFERDQILEDARLGVGQTPHSIATPANFDDSASQFSIDDNEAGKSMRITRTIVNKFGQEEETTEIVTDPRVWQEYQKRRRAINAAKKDVFDIKPTGDADLDKEQAAMVKKELARLERNKERRHAREKAKGKQLQRASTIEPGDAGSPSATPAPSIEKPTGTTRKCANCGQTGHIKTNKKLCPMLNGTMKPEDNAASQGGFGAITTPSFT